MAGGKSSVGHRRHTVQVATTTQVLYGLELNVAGGLPWCVTLLVMTAQAMMMPCQHMIPLCFCDDGVALHRHLVVWCFWSGGGCATTSLE